MSLANNSSVKKPSPPGTTDSPYLGSKISLVSKAKIRYEGILYTIDANESTVALSKVRSFGTEDRPTDRPVPARDEIFEYIIFRGADIEDLQVREPPQSTLTQDPAIVESSMYPTNARSATMGTTNNQTRSSSNQGTMSSPPVHQGVNKGLKSSTNSDPLRQLNFNQQQSTRPFSQQSTSAQLDGQDYSYNNQRRGRQQQQDYYNDFSGSNNNNNTNNRRGNQKYGYNNEWSRTNNSAWDNGYRQQQQTQRYSRQPQQQQQQQQNYEGNRFHPSRRMNNNNNNQQQQQSNGYYGYRERRNSTGGITGNQPRNNNRQQRERADSIRGNSNGRSALKFIGDFDFEKSNAEFDKNAIEDEIKKSLSIKPKKDNDDETLKTDKEKENDNQEQEQEQQPATQEQQQQEEQSSSSVTTKVEQETQEDIHPDGYYDKQKSFFDRISCETTEKEKTSNPRRNWNEERRINAETFGLKYRPIQGNNQRRGQGGYYYNNNNNQRYNNAGQQSYYGNGARYQRGGNGNYEGGQQRGRHTTYYNNTNRHMQAY